MENKYLVNQHSKVKDEGLSNTWIELFKWISLRFRSSRDWLYENYLMSENLSQFCILWRIDHLTFIATL